MVPIGAILPFYGVDQQLPADFLICGGGMITKTEFPELYLHLSQANADLIVDEERVRLPDLRGEFIRGWDNGAGIDKDRKLGSLQMDMFKEHQHNIPGWVQFWRADQGGFRSVDGNSDINVQDPPTNAVGGSETRPRNVAINYIIRARPSLAPTEPSVALESQDLSLIEVKGGISSGTRFVGTLFNGLEDRTITVLEIGVSTTSGGNETPRVYSVEVSVKPKSAGNFEFDVMVGDDGGINSWALLGAKATKGAS